MGTGEFELITDYFTWAQSYPQIEQAIGDDAALLAPIEAGHSLAVATDTLVSGVHFPDSANPYDIATRALAVNISDLAAMGARPYAFTLALTIPSAEKKWLQSFSSGLRNAAESYAIPLVGGDTSKGPLCISLHLLGWVERGNTLLRSSAKVGDGVYVDGSLGDGAAALTLLKAGCLARESYLFKRFYSPAVHMQLAMRLARVAHAAIDVSDGLLADLGHIAKASAVAIDIHSACLPVSKAAAALAKNEKELLSWMLAGGDDYRLCFTMLDEHAEQLRSQGFDITRIGQVCSGRGVQCIDSQGQSIELTDVGYKHFS